MTRRRSTFKKQTLQISLHATNLTNIRGLVGTSNPLASLTLIPAEEDELPEEIGQTEVIENSLSPRWATTFDVDFEFGNPSKILVNVYDHHQKHNTKMGSAVFELGKILGAKGSVKAKKLRHGGILACRVQKAPDKKKGVLKLGLRGIKLKNVEYFFGKSDPFFELSRQVQSSNGGHTWQLEYRSPVVMNDLNPEWEHISIGLDDLCDGEKRQPILISVRDWEKSGKHKFIGSVQTCLHDILQNVNPTAVGNPKNVNLSKAFQIKRKGKTTGNICVTHAVVTGELDGKSVELYSSSDSEADLLSTQKRFSFVDYVNGGLDLQLTVAIDFAASNGEPNDPTSLHYLHPDGKLNDYEKAIIAIGKILSDYDSDQQFPVVGFGAEIDGEIQHCFQLGPVPQVFGVEGILEAYRNQFDTDFDMSESTVFREVITHAAEQARENQKLAMDVGDQYYQILLILTDGRVTSVESAKEAIRAASDAPLSIVIVGIGRSHFSQLNELDNFGEFGGNGGRDICQFVEFEKHKNNKVSLTQATLDEIPDQVVDYFHDREIAPIPSLYSSRNLIVADEADD